MADVTVGKSAADEQADTGIASRNAAFRMSAKQKSLYAAGDVADGIKNQALNTFLLFYLTAACGLPGSLAGLALAIALAVDAITDPLFGYMSDNTRSRWGRRHPYMFGAAIPFAIALGMLYSVPDLSSQWATFLYVLGALVTLRIAFSAFVLPYAAIGAEITSDYTERSIIMTYRNFFHIVGVIACVVLGFSVFMGGEHGLTTRSAYAPFGWTLGLLVLASILISAGSTFGIRHRFQQIEAQSRSAAARALGELTEVFRNRSFLILFVTLAIYWIAAGTAASLAVHAYRYFWEIPPSAIQTILIATTAGQILGLPGSAYLLRRFEKHQVATWSLAYICVAHFTPPTLAILGVMPAPGPSLYALLSVIAIGTGGAITCVAVSFGSMMMDATDEHELLFGSRREGTYFAGLTFATKCAIGLGALVAGVALDLIGFPTDLATHPDQQISAQTARNLGIIFGPGAATIAVVAVAILARYRLTRSEHARIHAALAAHRSGD